jgi:hypothetical protein
LERRSVALKDRVVSNLIIGFLDELKPKREL